MIEQPKINWLDIETTGTEPNDNQVTEIAIVQTENGKRTDKTFHTYVFHNRWVVSPQYLNKFGAPKNHETAVSPTTAINQLIDWVKTNNQDVGTFTPTFGGKNLGVFDVQFLKVFAPNLRLGYQLLDIGNMYMVPDDPKPPNLDQCLRRGRLLVDSPGEESYIMGIYPNIYNEVRHTALEDVLQCVELYEIWHTFGHRLRNVVKRNPNTLQRKL